MDLLVLFSQWTQELIMSWGYLGVFLASFAGNATIIFPVPSFLAVFAAGSLLNPWLIGIVAGTGAALGEVTGYLLGVGSRKALKRKYREQIRQAKKIMEKYGMFSILVLFAATPLPDDVVGILAGIIKYDVKKFFAAALIGKIILYTGLAFAGLYGSWLVGGWSGIFIVMMAGFFFAVLFYLSKLYVDWRKGHLKEFRKAA